MLLNCMVRTLVFLVSASRLSGGEGRRSGFEPSGDQGQPGQAGMAVERLVGKMAVIEATGVLRWIKELKGCFCSNLGGTLFQAARRVSGSDVRRQIQFINKLFEVAA